VLGVGLEDVDMVSVKKLSDDTYEVSVKEGTATVHRVTLSDDYYQSLTGGKVTHEALIKKSFKFLLERESNASILRAFDLPVIGRYFPEYEQTMRKWLAAE